ncbi:hypothetical protein RvY_17907 [Ramazzottius varieornatus]|uniref:CUB domain-containing protein n=1 Tax=Ramazzottius varieornatus TaxID=947166 RepID=A0A1D1W4G5_RAMVA|nr:hypothetical protein RvY_17907 [Ramazzottius varieornatus]
MVLNRENCSDPGKLYSHKVNEPKLYLVFESPNYGHGNYSNNLDCITWITTDPDQKMVFHPYDVDLEDGWDNLYLYDTSPSTNPVPLGQHNSTTAPPSTSRNTSSQWSPVYPSSTLRPWNSSPRPSTWSGWNSTQHPTVAPITWEMENTTTITQTQSSGNTIRTTVQTVTRTATSVVVTDTMTTTHTYSSEGWSKIQLSENGFYNHENQKIE